VIDAENCSRANFFEQRTTGYLKAIAKVEVPDGVWAFEKRGDA
jgi:hypothetical protein